MAQGKKGKLNFRCPNCFTRDIDIDMFYDEDKKQYYCLRCSYVASEEEVLLYNQKIKTKYGHIMDRIVSFNEDNEDITYKKFDKDEEL